MERAGRDVLLFGFWMVVLEDGRWPRLTLAVSLEAIFRADREG